ncbi:glutamine amidotransferase [Herbaspirillum sp. NPDC101397]|uniref:glutamine amidotransferase n=1 Tax=Herbaspirillum sp. NPDC101397 TaxID=3364006 RepID=UPI00383BC433
MQCLVIRHLAFEDLGNFAPVLKQAGFAVDYVQAGVATLQPAAVAAADLLVVLGGPIGVNDSAEYPFINEEIALVRERLDSGKPVLGICLGAQMMAAALGARVYPGTQKEIGWGGVTLTGAGRASSLSTLNDNDAVLHWHGDTFDLPDGAELLASTAATPHQAFRYGRHALALQFHVEADADCIEAWLIGHACELSLAGIRPSAIRDDARRCGAQARSNAENILRAWLAETGLCV